MSGYALIIEGDERYYTTAGVASVSSWDTDSPTGATAFRGGLFQPEFTLSERMRPTEGECEVSALDFVLSDADGHVTSLWTRDESQARGTVLTAEATSAATTIYVRDSAAVGSLPRVVWVQGEAMLATAAPTGTTLTVTRGYLGTAARAIEYDDARAITPEVFVYPFSMTGRRVRFYKVDSAGVATLRWLGYVRGGPTIADNGVSYVVQCVNAWEQEGANYLASQEPAASVTGYDAKAIRGAVVINDGTVILRPAWPDATHAIFPAFVDALRAFITAMGDSASASGATNVITGARRAATGVWNVSLQYDGLARGEGYLTLAGAQTNATVFENSGTVLYTWEFDFDDGGALAFPGFGVPGQTDSATVIAPQTGLRLTDWATVAGSQGDTTLTPLLRGNLSDDFALELVASGQSTPGPVANDTAFTTLGLAGPSGAYTFHARASIVPRDITARTSADTGGGGSVTAITTALPLYSALHVQSTHWLDAVRSILTDDGFATSGSDSRNWVWSGYPTTRRLTGGTTAPVEYRLSGARTVSEFVTENARLRGACVGVSSGLLTLLPVVEPRATTSPVVTFTNADYIAGSRMQWEPNAEGVVTSVTIVSPVRALTVRDAVATGRHGQQRTIEVTTDGLRNDSRAINDPVSWALAVAGPLLTRWRRPIALYSFTVPASSFESLARLGSHVAFSSYSAPDGSGARGFTSKTGTVIGRTEDFQANTLTLDVLTLPTVYGFAPCCRVASIAGAVLTIAGGYAGAAGDYAGSTLSDYGGAPGDYGVGWFSPGDKVRLTQRDAVVFTAEDYTVQSVDTAAKTITLTTSVAAAPVNWAALCSSGIVDVEFQVWASTQASQRVFAAVADQTTSEIASGDPAQKWAP